MSDASRVESQVWLRVDQVVFSRMPCLAGWVRNVAFKGTVFAISYQVIDAVSVEKLLFRTVPGSGTSTPAGDDSWKPSPAQEHCTQTSTYSRQDCCLVYLHLNQEGFRKAGQLLGCNCSCLAHHSSMSWGFLCSSLPSRSEHPGTPRWSPGDKIDTGQPSLKISLIIGEITPSPKFGDCGK